MVRFSIYLGFLIFKKFIHSCGCIGSVVAAWGHLLANGRLLSKLWWVG